MSSKPSFRNWRRRFGAMSRAIWPISSPRAGASEPNTYKVLEVYKDQDALTHHGGTDYFKAAGPKFAGVLGGRPEIEYLDGVG